MDPNPRRTLRHQMNLTGWGVLCMILGGQLLAYGLMLLPGVWYRPVVSTLLSYVAMYLIAPWILWLFIRRLPRGTAPGLPLSGGAFARTAVVCVGCAYLFNYLTLGIIALLEQLTHISTGNLLEDAMDSMPMGLYLGLVAVAAPVFEELIFRRLLLDRLRPMGDRCAILLSAAAFALYHVNLYQFLYAFALGVLFAGVVLKTGKIVHSMLLHAIVNVVSYLLSVLAELDFFPASLLVLAVIFVSCLLTIIWLVRYTRTYRFAPARIPVRGMGQIRCLACSAGCWVCLVVCVALGTLVAFLS